MILDLTAPTLVLTGSWNVAIFSPPWLAHRLFGYEEGEEAPLAQMLAVAGDTTRQVLYFRNIGFHAHSNRIEIFANARSDQHLGRVEAVLLKLMDTLPHTPFGSLGINFRFVENGASDDVLEKLTTLEGIESRYRVLSSTYRTRIWIDENFVCNIERSAEGENVRVDLNYHCEKFNTVTERDALVEGIIGRQLQHAAEFLRSTYSLEIDAAQAHDFTEMFPDWEG